MELDDTEIRRIIRRMIARHPEYRVKPGEPYYVAGRDTYLFSSHHFIEQYRAEHQRDYAILLLSCMFSRIGQDRDAHDQIAVRLSQYADSAGSELTKVGRIALSRDVHGNMVRPMWWIFTM